MARKRDDKVPGRSGAGASGEARPASGASSPQDSQSLKASRSPAIGKGSGPRGLGKAAGRAPAPAKRSREQVIPDTVANRMARRIAIATGIPTVMGMGVFVASYFVVSRGILDIPPVVTLLASGGCFLLGLVGLSYGVLASSWEEKPGSLLGIEQIGLNISRVRASIKAMRQGGAGASGGPQG